MKATWNGKTIAESNDTRVVEGNHYFPAHTVNAHYLTPSDTKTSCFWKGQASYYTLLVDGEENKDAAWYYPQPSERAGEIKDHIAFWRGVKIEK